MPVAIADVGSDGRRHATGRQLQGARGLQLQPPSAPAYTSQRRCPQGWWAGKGHAAMRHTPNFGLRENPHPRGTRVTGVVGGQGPHANAANAKTAPHTHVRVL